MLTSRAHTLGYLLVLEKVAASRIDKEVAAGRARYEDLVPGYLRQHMGTPEAAKQTYRTYTQWPGYHPNMPAHREMNERLLPAQAARPDAAVGPGVSVSMPKSKAPATYYPAGRGVDYRTAPLKIEVSPRSGQYLRMMEETFDPELAERTLAKAPARLPAPHPMDATLNLATLQHEFGEAEALRKPVTSPHASHAGIEPLLRERMAVRQDPEAFHVLTQMRRQNKALGVPDDDLVFDRLYKQMGGTGASPIQPGTRRARALEEALQAHPERLLDETRREHVLDQLNAFSAVSGTGQKPQRVGMVPQELYDALAKELPTEGAEAIRRGNVVDTVRRKLRVKNPDVNALVKRYIQRGRL